MGPSPDPPFSQGPLYPALTTSVGATMRTAGVHRLFPMSQALLRGGGGTKYDLESTIFEFVLNL